MDDETAAMRVVLDKLQGELSPLEIGLHALNVVGKAPAGRGKKGGLSKYARQLGKTQPYITELCNAAEVYDAAKSIAQVMDLLDKAKHLAAIHGADSRAWPALVATMLAQQWAVIDVEYWVKQIRQLHIDPWCEETFLPYGAVVERLLETKEFSARTVNGLWASPASVAAGVNFG